MNKPKFLKWTVEFSVHEMWVEDGFDLDSEGALDMLGTRLGYANMTSELKAKVIARPEKKLIRKLQGYTD